jgi:hypothetical protein
VNLFWRFVPTAILLPFSHPKKGKEYLAVSEIVSIFADGNRK